MSSLARRQRPVRFARLIQLLATQLALALGLARFLADYDADRIPADRRIQVRRLAVVAAAV